MGEFKFEIYLVWQIGLSLGYDGQIVIRLPLLEVRFSVSKRAKGINIFDKWFIQKDMSKAEQILKKWYNPLHGIGDIAEIQITEAMKEYAMQCLKKASERACVKREYVSSEESYWTGRSTSEYSDVVDKKSIHNENNLV